MSNDKFKNKYRISSARLKGWNYGSSAYYFVTICTKNREDYFGNVIDGIMKFSDLGYVAYKCWQQIPKHFPFVLLDAFIVMPNHIHGVIAICKNNDVSVETQNFASLQPCKSNTFGPQSKNLASVIRGYKIGVKKYSTMNNMEFSWQPRFYDHIVRDDGSLNRIRKYILNNPSNWETDRNNLEDLYI